MRAFLRRYAGVMIAAVAVVAVAIGAWQFHAWRTRQAQEVASARYFEAVRLAQTTHVMAGTAPLSPDQTQALARFRALAADGPQGIRTLAQLRVAALATGSGDTKTALAAWEAVRNDAAADPVLRGLASLLWAERQLDIADPAQLRARLTTLTQTRGAWHGLAQEALAMLDLRQGHDADARRRLAALSQDPDAPDGVRARAGALLQTFAPAPAGH
nr:tetratricopeptide repeat protein [Ameyamaea chiangmaiensis]